MNKQRAQRRADREAQQRIERNRGARRRARRSRWRALTGWVRPPRSSLPRFGRRSGGSLLAAQRRRQNGILITVLLALHLVLWLLSDSWWLRVFALAMTVLLWPLLVTMVFDRRRS